MKDHLFLEHCKTENLMRRSHMNLVHSISCESQEAENLARSHDSGPLPESLDSTSRILPSFI